MTQSDANQSLRQDSLIIREDIGNFAVFGPLEATEDTKTPYLVDTFLENSLAIGTGN